VCLLACLRRSEEEEGEWKAAFVRSSLHFRVVAWMRKKIFWPKSKAAEDDARVSPPRDERYTETGGDDLRAMGDALQGVEKIGENDRTPFFLER